MRFDIAHSPQRMRKTPMLVTRKFTATKVAVMLLVCIAVFGIPAVLLAAMSSTNYIIPSDTISVGGNLSSSASWIANDTIGDTATGEDLVSASYAACAGYQCFQSEPFISFSVKEGTAAPGTSGAGVALGLLTTGAVTTSDGSSINSVFLTAESNAPQGMVVSVVGANGGLKSVGMPAAVISSATASLVAGTAGFGVCVFSVTQDGDSPSSLLKDSPYDGACTKTTSHSVGAIGMTPANILSSTAALKGGAAEVLVKAAIGSTTAGRPDYQEVMTFVATGTY